MVEEAKEIIKFINTPDVLKSMGWIIAFFIARDNSKIRKQKDALQEKYHDVVSKAIVLQSRTIDAIKNMRETMNLAVGQLIKS